MYREMFEAASAWQRNAMAMTQMMVTASTVIQIRMMQMSLGLMRPEEAARMVMEKPSAFAKSAEMSVRAMAANRGFATVALAAMKPVGAKTRANARRLTSTKGGRRRRS